MYQQENNKNRLAIENLRGETDPLVLKFVGMRLPVKGGSVVIETVNGETVWVTKFDSNGKVIIRDKDIHQSKILPIIEHAEQKLTELNILKNQIK